MTIKRLTRLLTITTALALNVTAFALPVDDTPVAQTKASEVVWSPIEDEWMIMEIGGGRVGWSNTVIERSGDQIRTTSDTQLKINRGPVSVEIQMGTVFLEKTDGTPVSLRFVQKMAAQAIDTTWEFNGDKVKQVSRIGGQETVKELDAPKDPWLAAYKAKQFVREQQRAGAKDFTFKTVNPENGIKLVTVTSKSAGESEYEMDGKKVPVQVWKSTTDIMPVESTEYYDAEGRKLYAETPTGIGKIAERAATKEQAMADAAGEIPELMERTFIKLDKPIVNSMKSTSAQFKITSKDGALPEIPSAGAQRVTMADDRKSAVLVIDIMNSLPASSGELGNDEYTEPNTMVDYEDALITKLASAVKDEPTTMDKVVKLRQIAHDRISKKGMATAFACASETAKTKTGDCSEHGVLLCALLRAQGIPARVAMGLVYVDQFMGGENIFGWHMWTQALVDGKWIDLDATLPVRYNAAHVLTSTSSLADGMGAADMASILQMIGNMDVEVIEVGYD